MLLKWPKKLQQKLVVACELLHSGGGSDANVIAGFDIPTVNLALDMKKFIQRMKECLLKNYISLQK